MRALLRPWPIFLGLSLVSCRVEHLEPKARVIAAEDSESPQNLVALTKDQQVAGQAVSQFYGVWELKTLQRQVETIDIQTRLNTHIYLVLKEDASALWYREDLEGIGYCESDLMAMGSGPRKDRLYFQYSYIKLNELSGELEGNPHLEQLSFSPELSADGQTLLLRQGPVPMTVAMIPEIATKFEAGEKITATLLKSSVDISKASPTQLYQAVCQKKNKIFQAMEGGIIQKPGLKEPQKPTVEVPDAQIPSQPQGSSKEETDDLEAIKQPLVASAYRIVSGRPVLFGDFDAEKDLQSIAAVETGRSEYLKVASADKQNIRLEVDFPLPAQDFDAIRIASSMKSDSKGFFRPGRILRIRTHEGTEGWKKLDQVYSGEAGLGAKDLYFGTNLRKNLDQYVFEDAGKKHLTLEVEVDYSAISSCRLLGFIPCFEYPSLLLDYLGVELVRFPEVKEEVKCSLDDIKGPWEFIRQKKEEDSPWLEIAKGDLDTEKKLAKATRADWLENGKLVRQTYALGKDLTLNVEGWTRCPDLRFTYTFDAKTCQATFTNTKTGTKETLRMEVDKTQAPWKMSAYRVEGDTEYVNEYIRRTSLDLPFVLLNVGCKN